MDLRYLTTILAMSGPARDPATPVNPTAEMLKMLGTFAIFGVIFYFVLIRPQQKRARQQAEMLKSIKRGDRVVTSSGIIGIVTSVKEKSVTLRSDDAKLEVTKGAVGEILERAESSNEG